MAFGTLGGELGWPLGDPGAGHATEPTTSHGDVDLTVHGRHIDCPATWEASVEQAADSLDFGETFLATSFLQHPWDENGSSCLPRSPSLRPEMPPWPLTYTAGPAWVPSCKKPGLPLPLGQRPRLGPDCPPVQALPTLPRQGLGQGLPRLTPQDTGLPAQAILRFQPREAENWDQGPELLPALPNPHTHSVSLIHFFPAPGTHSGPFTLRAAAWRVPAQAGSH